MALSDLILKARVNMALVRDPRVGVLDIGVTADDGIVTLTGDVDSPEECDAASQVALKVDGVCEVRNQMTCGVGKAADDAEMVIQQLLNKLDGEWNNLPERTALAEADYLRWALWLVYKFRLPDAVAGEDRGRLEWQASEQAISEIAARVGAPKALVALEMIRQAEAIQESTRADAPDIANAPLVATPVVEDDSLGKAA